MADNNTNTASGTQEVNISSGTQEVNIASGTQEVNVSSGTQEVTTTPNNQGNGNQGSTLPQEFANGMNTINNLPNTTQQTNNLMNDPANAPIPGDEPAQGE